MQERTTDLVAGPAEAVSDVLTEILRDGAQKLLATAIEAEVDTYIEQHADHRDADGHRLVVRNGHKDTRQIQTGIGPVAVRQPRVDDRDATRTASGFASRARSCRPTYGRRRVSKS